MICIRNSIARLFFVRRKGRFTHFAYQPGFSLLRGLPMSTHTLIRNKMIFFLRHTISDSMFFNYRILLPMNTTSSFKFYVSSLKFYMSSLLPRYSLVWDCVCLLWHKISGLSQTWHRGCQVGTPEVKFNKMPCQTRHSCPTDAERVHVSR